MLHHNASPHLTPDSTPSNLRLMPSSGKGRSASQGRFFELALIAARRCSGFFAEAAVLVLVFGILDVCLLKGRVELPWVFGALAISIGLLGASIAMDFTAHRWIKAHP